MVYTGRLRKKIDLLLAEEGYREGEKNWNKFADYLRVKGKRFVQNDAWCYQFQSYGTVAAGLEEFFLISAFCPEGVAWHKEKGWWSEYPMIGAEVFYGLPTDEFGAGGSHIETVIRFDADNIWTIGGNTNLTGASNGDGVYRRGPISRASERVHGYGCPPVDDLRLSADPRWGGLTAASFTELPPGTPPDNDRQPRPVMYRFARGSS